jgi:hypothetical protein
LNGQDVKKAGAWHFSFDQKISEPQNVMAQNAMDRCIARNGTIRTLWHVTAVQNLGKILYQSAL